MTHCNTCQENHDDPCRGVYDLDTRLLELRDERIAELEAELASERKEADTWWNYLCESNAHLNEAEAEVERLRKERVVLTGPSYEDALHAFHELRDFTTGSGRP